MKQIFLFILPAITLCFMHVSCKTSYYSSPDEFDGKMILLSEGGGFSGKTTQTIILENGQVFTRTFFPESLREDDRLSKKTTSQVFQKMESLKINQLSFMKPGNMSYSLILVSKDQKYELKWGDPGFSVPEEVLACFKFIKDQLNENQ